MENVWVIGDGPLAAGLGDLARQAGHPVAVCLFDDHEARAEPGRAIRNWRQTRSGDPAGIIIEAVVSSRDSKRRTLAALGDDAGGALLLTAALNASATESAWWYGAASRVVGFATLPPLENARVIEMLPPLTSDPSAVGAAGEFFRGLGKEPVSIADCVGGVLPRVVVNLVNEAAFALAEQVASREDIDRAMQLGTNYPQGPLAWGDLIGLDQVLGILEALGEVYGSQYRPAPLLRQLVMAGWWGQRTGRGFYEATAD